MSIEVLILCSGQEVGPLLEVPRVPKVGVSTKNKKVLSDRSNDCDGSERQSGNTWLGTSSQSIWTRSCMLNEVAEIICTSFEFTWFFFIMRIQYFTKNILVSTSRHTRY